MKRTLVPVLALLAGTSAAHAAEPPATADRPEPKGQPAWCAPEVEALSDGLCHIDGGERDGRRTLVIFLHGAIARNTTWQWTQERALLRQARQSHFEAIFPRAPLSAGGYAWPGSVKSQEAGEQPLIDGWLAARAELEARSGRPYDDVFVMGFSSGAYFVSSLALRGRIKVDGYAVFAGASVVQSRTDETPVRPPVYVGVCGDDSHTSPDSRSFGDALAIRGWPHRVDEQHVGHMFSDIHVAHAVSYLRAAATKARAQ